MIKKLINLGVVESLKVENAQVIRLVNILALFPVPVYLFYIGYGIYFDQWFSSALALSMIVLTGFSLWQNVRLNYGMAKVILLGLNGFSLWVTYHVFNVDYSVLTAFLPLIMAYTFLFDLEKEKGVFYFSALLTTFFIVSSFVLPKQLFYAVNLTVDKVIMSNYIHLAFSLVLTIFVALALFKHKEITNKKLILAREEAERYGRMQSEFLANMSHEIRTPLNGVIGSSELLAETSLTEEQTDYLETIDFSSRLLMGLINDVLDLSKIEADRMNLENQSFDLSKLIQDQILMLSPSIGSKPLKIDFDLEDAFNPMVKGDEKRVNQIIGNVLSNAIKFTREGKINIFVKNISHSVSKSITSITITDTGIGISEEDQKELFKKFYQVESNSTRNYDGTGLGLVISKKLATLMGGDISVESKLNEGSVFRIDIPFNKVRRKINGGGKLEGSGGRR